MDNNKSKIPQIIHQTWKDHNLPEYLQPLADSWKNKNTDWEYRLWTDELMYKFVLEHFPALMELYQSYPEQIYRADLFRLIVLYKMGGVYVDIDSKCIKSLNTLFQKKTLFKKELILTKQPESHFKYQYHHLQKNRICNSFIASVPQNKNIKLLIDELEIKKEHNFAAYETGPLYISKNFDNLNNSKIKVLNHKYFNPVVDITNKLIPVLYRKKSALMILKDSFYKETIGVHYWNHIYNSPNAKRSLTMSSAELNKMNSINIFDWLNLFKRIIKNKLKH